MEVFEVPCSLPRVKYRDTVLLLISAIKINFEAVAVSDSGTEASAWFHLVGPGIPSL